MRIKRFSGNTLKEATDKMRMELGSDAVILNTRKVAGNKLMNFLGKEMVEVTAAADGASNGSSSDKLRAEGKFASAIRQAQGGAARDEQSQGTFDELQNLTRRFEKRNETGRTLPQAAASQSTSDVQVLRGEMEEMRTVLVQIAEHLKYSKMPAMPLHLQEAYVNLVENDIDENMAADLVQALYARLDGDQLESKETIDKTLTAEIAKQFRAIPIPREKLKKSYVVAMVGPMGVGKTTTVVKLAAIHKLIHRQNVGLITTDTYRIGAIEQLRTFAGIAGIPMEVVYKPSEMEDALRGFRKKDIVFIDTVGRNQRAKKELTDLKKFIEAASPDEIHLVLSVSTNRQTLLDIINRFKVLKPSRLLFSKMDEALTLGGILSVVRQSQLPLSYVTNGQVVPDDILAADGMKLASMICQGAVAHA
jgi:flagellar biosynthesis protein FlhF